MTVRTRSHSRCPHIRSRLSALLYFLLTFHLHFMHLFGKSCVSGPAPSSPLHRCIAASGYTHHPPQPVARSACGPAGSACGPPGPCGTWSHDRAACFSHTADHTAAPPSHRVTGRSAYDQADKRQMTADTKTEQSWCETVHLVSKLTVFLPVG